MGFVCPRCQKEFTKKSNLQTHVENVHEKKRHKCAQCEKDFASRGGLRDHKLTKHEGKKRKINKKQCPHCKKSFNTGSPYSNHLLTHESLKPFLCPFCSSYAAKQLSNLKQHIDSIHFKCRWFCLMHGCNNSETTAFTMRNHLKKKHSISSNFVNHIEQRRTSASPSSLAPVRGKLPSTPTTNNDPREASTSVRQQSAQSFTVKHEDINNGTKLRSLLNRLELIVTSASSNSEAVDASSEIETEESANDDDRTDEAEDPKESESEDSALFLVEAEMNKRRRLVWHNPDAAGSSSDDDDDDNDDDNDNGDEQSNSKSSSSSSSFSFTSKPKEEPREEEEASSSSSGPPPRRIDVKPRMVAWIPTGESVQRGIKPNRFQQEPPEALELNNNDFEEQQEQERKIEE